MKPIGSTKTMSNVPPVEAPFHSNAPDWPDGLTEAEIARRLAQASQGPAAHPHLEFPALPQMLTEPPRPAAVLAPLLRVDNEWRLLFTRRNSGLPEHSGQVAFPGGRADPEDQSPEHTALREAFEEIGLKPEDVHVLGRTANYLTITNYLVTPVIGVIPWPYLLRPAAEEVSRVFTIPLRWLADPANHEERLRELPTPFGSATVIYFQPFDGEVLWGASARITLNLLRILKNE
jgi:8-oxo-dGTP pyrophosphatase MutT (NUDIX family)